MVSAVDGAQRGSVGPPAKKARVRKLSPPDIPDEYRCFSGRVVEVHADDDNAGAAFEELFSRSRFEASFPQVASDFPMVWGIDFEWKPDRDRFACPGNPIALIQVSCWDSVLLIRTTGCNKLPEWLQRALEDPNIVKVTAGFDISDKSKLKHTFGWDFDERVSEPACLVDVAEIAKELDLPCGLKKLSIACAIPMLKPKIVGRSNWATEVELSDAQRTYAAEDAFFTLMVFGSLLAMVLPKEGAHSLIVKADTVCKAMRKPMESKLNSIDNRAYRVSFMELREAVKEGVESLCNALGSCGCTSFSKLFKVKGVQKVLKDVQKKKNQALTLTREFIRSNEDIFVFFVDKHDGDFKVRPRKFDEEDDYNEDVEEEWEFITRVVDLIVQYETPAEKKPNISVFGEIFEVPPVPGRAILSANEQKRWMKCANEFKDFIETNDDATDGIVLKLIKHPKSADPNELLKVCMKELQAHGVKEEEAERRLKEDSKFATFFQTLPTLARDTAEEAVTRRSLMARTRILVDAHQVSERVGVSWEVVRDAIKKVKWHRQLLAKFLACKAADDEVRLAELDLDDAAESNCQAIKGDVENANSRSESSAKFKEELNLCLEAIVKAWPDVASVTNPAASQRPQADKGKRKQKGKAGKVHPTKFTSGASNVFEAHVAPAGQPRA